MESTNERVARRVKELRGERRMLQADLANRIEEIGGWGWTQSKIAKLEKGQRKITIDELMLLALALDTTPLFLLAPPGEALALAGNSYESEAVRLWFRGYAELPGQDYGRFWSTVALMEPQVGDIIRAGLAAQSAK